MWNCCTEEALLHCLRDAGCTEETAQTFLRYYRAGTPEKGACLLERQRAALLETCHCAEKKIDCIDYLLYHLKKQKEQ